MARALARAATGPLGDFESSFEAAVAERLAAKGWVLQPQNGGSTWRRGSGCARRVPGGIECDGDTYPTTAGDRDRLRQVVLERMLRAWSVKH